MNSPHHKKVCIAVDDVPLRGELFIPAEVKAIVILSAERTGQQLNAGYPAIIRYLHEKNYGTLLVSLITRDEGRRRRPGNGLDDELLCSRLSGVKTWLEHFVAVKQINVGYFGAEARRLCSEKIMYSPA